MGRHIDLWLEGWRRGDAEMVMSSVADDFIHDDPVDGRFTRDEFAAYLAEPLRDRGHAAGLRERSTT